MTLNRFLFAPALLATLAVPAAAQQRVVTLPEAIAMAQRVQVSIRSAEGAVRTTAAARMAAIGEFTPSVNASANGSNSYSEFQRPDPVTQQILSSGTSTTSLSAGLSASINLFSGFSSRADLAAADANQRAAAAGLITAHYGVVVST
ncbi:MAG: TolC family protein, partial [Gemmatimonadales bacterium]